MENRAFLRQRNTDTARSRSNVDREPTMVPGRQALTDQLHGAYFGATDHYTVAVESAEREIKAVRSTALPALVAALRKKDIAPIAKEIEVARAAMQVRQLLMNANAHVYALELGETHKDPVIAYLRAELEKLVRLATRLGVYRGAEEMIPQGYEKPKPQSGGSDTEKRKHARKPAPANKSASSPTTPAQITKPAKKTETPSPRMRAPRLASGGDADRRAETTRSTAWLAAGPQRSI